MVVGQGVTSRFFDFGVVGRCFKQRWGHLGGVFSELGIRGGRIQKWSYEVVVNRGGGGNLIVIFWWRFAHPILTHLKYWKRPMAGVRGVYKKIGM